MNFYISPETSTNRLSGEGAHITQRRMDTTTYIEKSPVGENFQSPLKIPTRGSENFAQNVGPCSQKKKQLYHETKTIND